MKVILVGGNKGLGAAIHERLLKRDDECIALSRNSEDKLDLRWEDARTRHTIRQAAEKLGSLDALIVSSGMGAYHGPLLSDSIVKDMFQVNAIGPMACYRGALRSLLRSQGKAIFVTSVVYRKPSSGGLSYYAATKGALNSWIQAENRRAMKHGVALCAVAAGFFNSAMTEDVIEPIKRAALRNIPARRYGEVGEIADFTVSLLDQSNWCISGSIFEVSGGA